MRIFTTFIPLLISACSFAQMRPIDKVYIVEGVVADRETLKALPSAILYNDSLGITTTSDENGYFKIVVPYELMKNRARIPIDIVKTDYKRIGTAFIYNQDGSDTIYKDPFNRMIWDYNVHIFWMAKDQSNLSSTSSGVNRAKQGVYDVAIIKQSFDNAVVSTLRRKKFDQLKEGNDKVYFPLDGETGLATSRYNIVVIGNLTYVYINDKKVSTADINNLARRDEISYDKEKSDILTKKYGKETLAFVTAPISKTTTDDSFSVKATLIIKVEN